MPSVWPRTYHLSCNKEAIFSKDLAQEPDIPVDGQIRRMMPNHVELLRLFWGSHYCDSDWLFSPPADVVLEWLSDTNTRIWGFSYKDMLLATLMFRRLAEKPWSIMSVDCICVHRDARGQGLTAMLLENVIYQGARMGWLQDKQPFTILGFREGASLLHNLVPPLAKAKYAWCVGLAPPLSMKEETMHLSVEGTKVILYNTWRRCFPHEKEQWEVCWVSGKGHISLSLLRSVVPNNIQLWLSSLYIDFSQEKGGSWSQSEGDLLLECWGRPISLTDLPYRHF
jgi:GNAT superfamily N-acetyltransferase